jgi:hypothetical protein
LVSKDGGYHPEIVLFVYSGLQLNAVLVCTGNQYLESFIDGLAQIEVVLADTERVVF